MSDVCDCIDEVVALEVGFEIGGVVEFVDISFIFELHVSLIIN